MSKESIEHDIALEIGFALNRSHVTGDEIHFLARALLNDADDLGELVEAFARELEPIIARVLKSPGDRVDQSASEQDRRIKNCGVVYHENQSTNKGYVGPPVRRITGNEGPRFTVQPLERIKPKPGMEIHSAAGEAYTIPLNFVGDWFDIRSPTGKPLIP